MNVELPKKYKLEKKDIIIYTISILACLIALVLVIVAQEIENKGAKNFFGTKKIEKISENEETELRKKFNNMFTNTFTGDVLDSKKIENDKEFVYTGYQNQENVSGSYSLNVNIPHINIQSSILDGYNQEIEKNFKQKTNEILNSKGKQIVYTVDYSSFVEDNVLTIVIRSNIKQGSNAQQVMFYTYNYDLLNKKEINIKEMIAKLNYSEEDVQTFIKNEIKDEEKNSKSLKELGYNIYVRNSEDQMYMLENTNEFFILNGKMYIIYAYGNTSNTSEMDLIIM